MFFSIFMNLIFLALNASTSVESDNYPSGNNTDQAAALQFLQDINHQLLKVSNEYQIASWNFQTNITEVNKIEMIKKLQAFGDFQKESQKNASSFAWKDFKDTNKTAYQMFKILSVLGTAALPEEKFREHSILVADMGNIHATAKTCSFSATSDTPCNLTLEPELTKNCASYRKQEHFWSQYRDVTGKKMKDKFIRYVELSNEAAKLNGFSDNGGMWRSGYESYNFTEDLEELWQTLKPLYEQLHAYVRTKLIEQYPCGGIKIDGPIPAHLIGGGSWKLLFDTVSPYPEKETIDVTKMMNNRNMTALDLFKLSEEFFTSLGLSEMTPEFWNRSVFVKPTDREFNCFPEAVDFYDGKDFRIRMCTEVDMDNLIVIHHEMGHIEYFMHFAKQPAVFRGGANPGFHEAIGDTIALSVRTPEHLKKIGLLEEVFDDKEEEINTLLSAALEKIAFAPFAYLIDAWRWKVFDGSISKEELNQKYWEMRLQYQGLCPPVRRTNEDLDAGATYHVANNTPYIRYFISNVIQFQFHKALCEAAGHQGPLHKCDIYNNKKAGKMLSDMLRKGSSEHWEEAMSAITNGKSRKMDATPMVEYFAPLMDWLKEQNKNVTVGWKSSDPMICP